MGLIWKLILHSSNGNELSGWDSHVIPSTNTSWDPQDSGPVLGTQTLQYQDRCVSASWNAKFTVLLREQCHDQPEPTVLWGPGEMSAGGQEQRRREKGHDPVMLRAEGSDKASHLVMRRWDSSALVRAVSAV